MKNISLRNLGWFSFTSDLDKLKHLSIYQAIAYVLRKEAVLVLEVNATKRTYTLLRLNPPGKFMSTTERQRTTILQIPL